MMIYNPTLDFVNDNVYTEFGLNKSIHQVLKILNKNWIPTSIKGRNSVANLRKMMIYNPNLDLVNDNVYTKLVSISLFIFKILNKN